MRGLWLGVLLALSAAACGHRQETALLDQFFSASRLRDRTAAQSVATVFFDPADQGLVRQFTVRTVTPEERHGDVTTKSVTVGATVESPDGRRAEQTIFVTMERRRNAGWMITGMAVSAPGPARPPR